MLDMIFVVIENCESGAHDDHAATSAGYDHL